MNKIDYKNIMTLAHLFDFLEGGVYHGYWQLEHINKQAFELCENNNTEKILKLIDDLKGNLPSFVSTFLKNSKEIRYLCCDSFHDAQIINLQIDKNIFIIKLDMDGSYCGFNYKSNIVKIEIETNGLLNESDFNQIINFKSNPLLWIGCEIEFKDLRTYLNIELSNFDANKNKMVNHLLSFELKNITFYN